MFQQAAAFVGGFGGHEGQVLTELTRAGLSPADAAIIGSANDNPVALSAYARARARGNVGLTPTQRRDTRAKVVERLGPLLSTWAPLPNGQSGSDAFVTGVETVAASLVADGRSPDQAAREATQTYLDAYRFNDGWRMPRAIAATPRIVAEPQSAERMGNPRRAAAAGMAPQQRTQMPATEAAELGALRLQADWVRSGGAGLYAAGSEAHLSDAQKRSRMADVVANRGRWVTTYENDGLMLVQPDATNAARTVPILGADGRPIRRTWQQLFDRAARPSRDPR